MIKFILIAAFTAFAANGIYGACENGIASAKALSVKSSLVIDAL